MTCSTTSRKRRRQSWQDGDNLDMMGHSKIEGLRWNVIMKKHASVQFEILLTTSFHLYFVMTINYFGRWIENGCTSVIEWANVLSRDWKHFWRLLQNTISQKTMSDVHYICFPCIDYRNKKKTRDIKVIREHLLVRGFVNIRMLWEVMMM
jgi:hypothetical protein